MAKNVRTRAKKKAKHVPKKKAKRVRKSREAGIRVDVKVGILHTVANAIYSTPAGKLREAVANARDNDAEWVVIVVDRAARSIFICDNGTGITRERFHQIFEAIGYGFGRDESEPKLSYFGLGLMSIFQLGNKVEMFTRAMGTKRILKLQVDTQGIFSQVNERRSVSELNRYISLGNSDEGSRRSASANLINETLGKEEFKDTWDSFTEIIIRDMPEEDLETICDDEFVDEVRKWFPLKPDRDEPFLNRLAGRKGKRIRELLESAEFCATVDVYFGMEEEKRVERLWKYFPALRADVTFTDDNTYIGKSRDGDFGYYFVHSIAVDLQRRREGEEDQERETGFWVRNQNFLVKSADFLERTGPGRKIKPVHEPLKPWIFGEILHKDMNKFLTVSRNEFLFEKEGFKKLQKELIEIVDPLNRELRTIHKKKREVLKGLVEPFIKLRDPKGLVEATEKRLRQMLQPYTTDKEFWDDASSRLGGARDPTIEREEARVDILLRRRQKAMTLGEDEDVVVRIDPGLRGKVESCDVTWDAKNKKVVALLSPDLFEPKELTFLGRSFQVIFVAEKEAAEGVSVDVDAGKIWVNPFNRELTQYTVSIFDVYLALQIAKSISVTPKDMARNTLTLLGARCEVSERYITPLGDDLRRTVELARRRA
ncbi:MAG: ATP-binding protein [Planctomycetota bacterium]|jgi:hypothetical protein